MPHETTDPKKPDEPADGARKLVLFTEWPKYGPGQQGPFRRILRLYSAGGGHFDIEVKTRGNVAAAGTRTAVTGASGTCDELHRWAQDLDMSQDLVKDYERTHRDALMGAIEECLAAVREIDARANEAEARRAAEEDPASRC